MSVHSPAVHMMDNASALPTCAQQQQQEKLLLIKIDQKLPTRLRDEALFRTAAVTTGDPRGRQTSRWERPLASRT
jgi:hypothetical protein